VEDAASLERMALEQDQRISEVVKREQSRLRDFIRRRVPDPRDVEDILQDVFAELVEWLVPDLLGVRRVTFWHALGLLALCRILFGGFGKGGGAHSHRGSQRSDLWRAAREEWHHRRSGEPPATPAPPASGSDVP